MNDASSGGSSPSPSPPRWQPMGAIDRRVLGVLAEKAKTTPDIYPMSLNAICTGCNQKNNRWPLMQLEPDQVEESLDRLREWGRWGWSRATAACRSIAIISMNGWASTRSNWR